MVDHGWLRILGGGAGKLPSLAQVNRLADPTTQSEPPSHLLVGYDVLGGRFAIDGGGLSINPGEVCYWGPDTLSWRGLEVGHGAFISSFMSGAARDFYSTLRWTGWENEGLLPPTAGLKELPARGRRSRGGGVVRVSHRLSGAHDALFHRRQLSPWLNNGACSSEDREQLHVAIQDTLETWAARLGVD